MEATPSKVDLSLLVCTYNRCEDLRELLETALAQETEERFSYEVLVVDNNSTDNTRSVVEEFISAGHKNLRYLFEERQGKSHALNTGLQAVQGWSYVIADDDFILPKNWARGIYDGLTQNPDVAFVSGKVLPLWQGEPPGWLTSRHWSALAMADYGDEQFITDESHQICLLACAFRINDVAAVGGYHGELGPHKDRTGGTEDLDLLIRLWKSGRKGLYLPHVSFHHKATGDRLTKSYHRRWHRDHGRNYAIMNTAETEKGTRRFLGVPAYMYREAMRDVVSWLTCVVRGRTGDAFWHETQLRFFQGYFATRRSDHARQENHST